MSKHFLIWAWCEDCSATRDLTVHGKCGTCGSAAVTVREKHALPEPTLIKDLLALEEMFHLTEQVERTR